MKNKLKQLFKNKTQVAGYTLALGSSRVTDIMSRCGIDFLMVDMQHGHFNKTSATDSIRGILATPTVPIARVANNSHGEINDMLDAGALGIVVPMINNAEDAKHAVAGAFYPPLGVRSKGSSAPVVWGDDYANWINDEVILVVMIETQEALNNVDEIFAVTGVDYCLIGTSDLSFNLKCKRDSQQIRDAVQKVIDAGKRHNVVVGSAIGTPDEIAQFTGDKPAFYLISHDLGLLRDISVQMTGKLMQAMQRD